MAQLRRIALLLLSLFIFQILASSELQQSDAIEHIKAARLLTLTFENPKRYVTVTFSEKREAFQTPTVDQPNKQDYPMVDELNHEQFGTPMDPNPQDMAPNYAEDMRPDNLQNHDHLEDSLPFNEFVGDDIEKIFYGSEPVAVIEEEVNTNPAPASIIEDDIVSVMSANKTVTKEPTSLKAPVAQVTGCKTQGQIALTYNEGPSDVTAKIVRQLSKADARGNFFVNATWLYTQQYAMVVQNIYNAGHFIGMTYRAANDDPASMTDEQLRQDILNDAHIIETLINVAPKYVRLHYTEVKDTRTEGILQDLGFVIVGYNLDSQDYSKKDATGPDSIQQIYSDTFKNYKDTYDAKGSFISIQYDLPYTGSLAAIPHIINTIEEEGYTMVRLDGCLNDATPYKKSANSTEYIGDKFSFGQANYHQGQKSIVLESAAEAAAADEKFQIQGIGSSTENMASSQKATLYAYLIAVSAIFALLL